MSAWDENELVLIMTVRLFWGGIMPQGQNGGENPKKVGKGDEGKASQPKETRGAPKKETKRKKKRLKLGTRTPLKK